MDLRRPAAAPTPPNRPAAPAPPPPRGRRRLFFRLLGLALLVALGLFWHPPVYIVSPGRATDIARDVTIRGVPATVPQGRYLLVTVLASQHSLFADLLASLHAHRQVITTSQVGSVAVQYQTFDESRVLAAAAAGRAAGLNVTLNGDGAEVTAGTAGSSLQAGDLLVAAGGAPVRTEFDLEDIVAAQPVGTRISLAVRRTGRTVAVTTARAPSLVGGTKTIGIGAALLTRNLSVASPFTVTFRSRAIGGPSAGLVYALAVSDALGSIHLPAGQALAATGTIDAAGRVGDVGDVDLKALGARPLKPKLFLVPSDEASMATGLLPDVAGVGTLADALRIVRTRA